MSNQSSALAVMHPAGAELPQGEPEPSQLSSGFSSLSLCLVLLPDLSILPLAPFLGFQTLSSSLVDYTPPVTAIVFMDLAKNPPGVDRSQAFQIL